MEFPLYKEWMSALPRTAPVYVQGVREFLKFAQRNLDSDVIPCPCNHCRNGKRHPVELVELHLVKWGMEDDYTFWCFHGERKNAFIPEEVPTRVNVHVGDCPSGHPVLNNLVDDAYGVHHSEGDQTMHFERDDQHVDVEINGDDEYVRLKLAASQPLYSNCNKDHTTLYAMIGLQNVKSQFGLSGNSMIVLLLWVKDLLPADNSLPSSYPSMKSTLKGLWMKYKSIHACRYDCILCRKEHELKDKCPVCNEPRFLTKKDPHRKGFRIIECRRRF